MQNLRVPTPIIFERLKLPQQIIYLWKENLSESPNHLKYRENVLILRLYKQSSRSTRNLGQFWNRSSKKFQTLRTQTYHIWFWSRWSGDSKYITFCVKFFAVLRKHLRISRNTLLVLSYIFGISRSPTSKWYMICLCSTTLKFFRTSKNGLNSNYFAKIVHEIATSKYFPDILND